jgi:hypothetical protein
VQTRALSRHPWDSTCVWLKADAIVTISSVSGLESLPPHVRAVIEAQIRNNPRRLVRIIDYLVVPTYDHGGRVPAGHAGPFRLAAGVRIEQLDQELVERLYDATSLRGEDWRPTRVFHAVHAYVRDVWAEGQSVAPTDSLSNWDHERRIWPVVQLSRLVRDNSTSTEHAVRRLVRADGTEQLIPFDGFESHVIYRLYPDRPGWLDVDEASELRALATAYWSRPVQPGRVGRALRRVESITGERYVEDAMPLVVGAFESLTKIGRDFARAQFSQRVPALAAEVNLALSTDECKEVYDDRSALVHGSGVDLSLPHDLDEFGCRFNALQEALRRIVRRAIEDLTFASTFEDDVRITARWPATVTARGVDTTI